MTLPLSETSERTTGAFRPRIKPGVLGATGYAGQELIRLLAHHPRVALPVGLSRPGEDSFGESADHGLAFERKAPTEVPFSWDSLVENELDLLFLATPHEVSRELAPQALQRGLRVIDLSGAWRLKKETNRKIYQFIDDEPTVAEAWTRQAVYGLPELHRPEIEKAELVANPGCYATSVILALAPLLRMEIVDRDRGIISDSKSGVSGAGKALTARTQFVSVADNLSAYSLFTHRHVGEIAEQLSIQTRELTFTPHLLPIPRGIFSTIYVSLRRQLTAAEVADCYATFYSDAPWVRLRPAGSLPEIRHSLHTNYCDIGFALAEDGRRLVVVSCLDNLMKGAAGQAVQNMNVMYGWDEKEGLN